MHLKTGQTGALWTAYKANNAQNPAGDEIQAVLGFRRQDTKKNRVQFQEQNRPHVRVPVNINRPEPNRLVSQILLLVSDPGIWSGNVPLLLRPVQVEQDRPERLAGWVWDWRVDAGTHFDADCMVKRDDCRL